MSNTKALEHLNNIIIEANAGIVALAQTPEPEPIEPPEPDPPLIEDTVHALTITSPDFPLTLRVSDASSIILEELVEKEASYELDEGSYTLEALKSGHSSVTKTVDLLQDETVQLDLVLLEPPSTGLPDFQNDPAWSPSKVGVLVKGWHHTRKGKRQTGNTVSTVFAETSEYFFNGAQNGVTIDPSHNNFTITDIGKYANLDIYPVDLGNKWTYSNHPPDEWHDFINLMPQRDVMVFLALPHHGVLPDWLSDWVEDGEITVTGNNKLKVVKKSFPKDKWIHIPAPWFKKTAPYNFTLMRPVAGQGMVKCPYVVMVGDADGKPWVSSEWNDEWGVEPVPNQQIALSHPLHFKNEKEAPDGKMYGTYHPPIDVHFGAYGKHEHGSEVSNALWGYTNNDPHGMPNELRSEPLEGFKGFKFVDIPFLDKNTGQELNCDLEVLSWGSTFFEHRVWLDYCTHDFKLTNKDNGEVLVDLHWMAFIGRPRAWVTDVDPTLRKPLYHPKMTEAQLMDELQVWKNMPINQGYENRQFTYRDNKYGVGMSMALTMDTVARQVIPVYDGSKTVTVTEGGKANTYPLPKVYMDKTHIPIFSQGYYMFDKLRPASLAENRLGTKRWGRIFHVNIQDPEVSEDGVFWTDNKGLTELPQDDVNAKKQFIKPGLNIEHIEDGKVLGVNKALDTRYRTHWVVANQDERDLHGIEDRAYLRVRQPDNPHFLSLYKNSITTN